MDIRNYVFNGIAAVFGINEENCVRLLYLGREKSVRFTDNANFRWFRNVEVQICGENHNDHHFNKHFGASEGFSLKFVSLTHMRNESGDILVLVQENERVRVESSYQFYDGVCAVRSYTTVENISGCCLTLDIVSSFENIGIFSEEVYDWEKDIYIYIPHNNWKGECAWKRYTPHELGLYDVEEFSAKRVSARNTGGWSSSEYLPMGMAERSGNGFVLWQIESNGSWNWEISTIAGRLYLLLNGPSAGENDWSVTLRPGEKFESVKCALAYAATRDGAFAEMTSYRRKIRRINEDNEKLPVIFNDYMNCLFGDPTTEKEIPLIDRAAELGIEYYCIDCGWYDDGDWWTTVGEWKPAQTRFRGGLKKLTDYIRSKGMVPGLWLEIEVMGIESELAKRLPDSWFFMRGGRRVIDHGRYQLDFSVPEVRAYADGVVDRLVSEYGVGYIKNDYNINCGKGSNQYCGSCGDGLLKHNRGFVSWLEGVYRRHPHLVIENCASGGLRMDYVNLALDSIQSTSDQTDYRKYAAISANCASAVTPEQAAVWSYPLKSGDVEETAFNMVNAMLFRIHQSGNIAQLSAERFALVKEGIEVYKKIRGDIGRGFPVFLTDFAYYDAPFLAYALKTENKFYIALWNLDSKKTVSVRLPKKVKNCEVLYPAKMRTKFGVQGDVLTFEPENRFCARLFIAEY